eukprot:6283852-Amphidinium_carterae.1
MILWQHAGKLIGIKEQNALHNDMHFGKLSFQAVLPHTEQCDCSWNAWQQPPQVMPQTHEDFLQAHPAHGSRDGAFKQQGRSLASLPQTQEWT